MKVYIQKMIKNQQIRIKLNDINSNQAFFYSGGGNLAKKKYETYLMTKILVMF